MRNVLRRLRILLFGVSPAVPSDDKQIEVLRKYRLLNLIPGIGVFALFPMGILAYFQGYRTIAAFNLVVSAYLVLAIVYVRKTGREQGAIVAGILLCTVYFYYLFATGGTFSAGFVWFPIQSLVAFFLLGARRGIVAAVFGLLLLLLHPLLAPLFSSPVDYTGNFMVRFIVAYAVVSLFAFSFVKAREIAQEALESNNRELNRTLGELHAAREAMEAASSDKALFLSRAQAQAKTLARLATEPALHAGDLQAACATITEAVAETLGVARVSIWLHNASRDAIECKDLFLRTERRHTRGQILSAADYPAYFTALRAERTIAAAEAHRDPRTAEFSASYLTPLGIASMLDATIRGGDEIIGVLCCESTGPERRWSLDEQNYAGSVSDLVALTIQARERRQAREQLLAASKAATAASEAKSRFLANMSHEIRTPMNGILGMAELLAGTALDNRQKGFVHDIRGSGEHLLAVINDILDISKIEAGRMSLESVALDPSGEARRVVDLFAEEARRKALALECAIPADLPGGLCGDPMRLRQVLVNLVGNAVKFTERGKVTVSLAKAGEDASTAEVRFEVRDTGVGIPPGVQAGIFDRFAQADDSTTRRFGGTGLGLTISRQLVELMGGRIGVESREGEGSAFWFAIRLVKGPVCVLETAPAVATATAATAERARYSGRVLVAEDNRVNQEVAIGMLAVFGLQSTVAGNGCEAVAAWRSGEFDLILMDCQMPEMDGYEAARLIREQEGGGAHGGRRTPIVALTAHALEGDRQLSFAAGMDDHIGKPFTIERLEAILERWLKPSGKRQA